MIRIALLAAVIALAQDAPAVTRLTFDEVLARVEKAHDVSPSAIAAADVLDAPPPRISFPTLRIETSATTANSVDFLARNAYRYDALTSLLSVDYPLIDGGIREKQIRLAHLRLAQVRLLDVAVPADVFRHRRDPRSHADVAAVQSVDQAANG